MSLQEISVDSAAALAMEFVRSSCSSEDVSATAKAVGVGMLFFKPKKRASIWVEVFCVAAGIASHSLANTQSSRAAIRVAQSVFELQVLRQATKLLGQGNEAIVGQILERIRAYKAALLTGQDAIGLSTLLMDNICNDSTGIKRRNGLSLVPIVASMQLAMRDGMRHFKIVDDDDE